MDENTDAHSAFNAPHDPAPMSAGANLSHAARLAFDGQRGVIGAGIHLEAAGIQVADVGLAYIIEDLGEAVSLLQEIVDDYARAGVSSHRTDDSPEHLRSPA